MKRIRVKTRKSSISSGDVDHTAAAIGASGDASTRLRTDSPAGNPQLISALAGSCGFAVEAHDPDKKSMVAEAIPTVPGGKKSA
jgi:hypothetical protein